MAKAKLGISEKGEKMHYSVGAIIKIDGKYLLIDRVKIPLGFACPAGHVDEGETPEESLRREVREETGLEIVNSKLLFEAESRGLCSRKVESHYWYVYECETEGKITLELSGAKSIGLYTKEEMSKLKFEPAWSNWFKRLKIL